MDHPAWAHHPWAGPAHISSRIWPLLGSSPVAISLQAQAPRWGRISRRCSDRRLVGVRRGQCRSGGLLGAVRAAPGSLPCRCRLKPSRGGLGHPPFNNPTRQCAGRALHASWPAGGHPFPRNAAGREQVRAADAPEHHAQRVNVCLLCAPVAQQQLGGRPARGQAASRTAGQAGGAGVGGGGDRACRTAQLSAYKDCFLQKVQPIISQPPVAGSPGQGAHHPRHVVSCHDLGHAHVAHLGGAIPAQAGRQAEGRWVTGAGGKGRGGLSVCFCPFFWGGGGQRASYHCCPSTECSRPTPRQACKGWAGGLPAQSHRARPRAGTAAAPPAAPRAAQQPSRTQWHPASTSLSRLTA